MKIGVLSFKKMDNDIHKKIYDHVCHMHPDWDIEELCAATDNIIRAREEFILENRINSILNKLVYENKKD
jgi:adenosyl cobinamide kinase/adenosyl cobinamide phosphate guanylyltransferase